MAGKMHLGDLGNDGLSAEGCVSWRSEDCPGEYVHTK